PRTPARHSAAAVATSPTSRRWPRRCGRRSRPTSPVSSRVRAAVAWTASSTPCAAPGPPSRRPDMLLELARWLEAVDRFLALFGYLTLRAILSALTALAVSLIAGPWVIGRLSQLKGGQPIRKDGPQSHF